MARPIEILPPNLLEYDRTEFDREMLKRANAYSLCEFWGVGKYSTQFFVDLEHPIGPCPWLLEEAREVKAHRLEVRPTAHLLIYGIIVGPKGPLLSIFVE